MPTISRPQLSGRLDLPAQACLVGARGPAPAAPRADRRHRPRAGGAAPLDGTRTRVPAAGRPPTRSRPHDDGRAARRTRGQGPGRASARRRRPPPQRRRAHQDRSSDARKRDATQATLPSNSSLPGSPTRKPHSCATCWAGSPPDARSPSHRSPERAAAPSRERQRSSMVWCALGLSARAVEFVRERVHVRLEVGEQLARRRAPAARRAG